MRGVKRPHTENGTEEISDQLDLLLLLLLQVTLTSLSGKSVFR